MADTNLQIEHTTAWTLGRICDTPINTIDPDVLLHPLIEALVTGLRDTLRIAANRCRASTNFAEQTSMSYDEEGPSPT